MEPTSDVPDDGSGRIRAAVPMARSEIELRAITAGPAPAEWMELSTFRDSAGEIEIGDEGPKPKRHRGRAVALALGLVALTGMAVATLPVRERAKRVLAAALALRRPAPVRVNFNSDPEGATVARADGTVLGVTPLSTEVPYGDTAIEYAIGKVGYRSKAASIVPNLSSPLFAVLQKVEPIVEPIVTAPPSVEAIAAPRPVARRAVARSARHLSKGRLMGRVSEPATDRDGVLDPSYR